MSAALRHDEVMTAGIAPPTEAECAAVWPTSTRVPTTPRRPHPALWLMGCHGGAGVTTLEAWLSVAGDCQRSWPGGHPEQSPFVLLVAEESVTGLEEAHLRLRQFRCGMAGPGNRLLGLVTVARVPGKRSAVLEQSRELLRPLAGELWHVPAIPGLRELHPRALPAWAPGDPMPERRRRFDPSTTVPPEVAAMGAGLVSAIRDSFHQERP